MEVGKSPLPIAKSLLKCKPKNEVSEKVLDNFRAYIHTLIYQKVLVFIIYMFLPFQKLLIVID